MRSTARRRACRPRSAVPLRCLFDCRSARLLLRGPYPRRLREARRAPARRLGHGAAAGADLAQGRRRPNAGKPIAPGTDVRSWLASSGAAAASGSASLQSLGTETDLPGRPRVAAGSHTSCPARTGCEPGRRRKEVCDDQARAPGSSRYRRRRDCPARRSSPCSSEGSSRNRSRSDPRRPDGTRTRCRTTSRPVRAQAATGAGRAADRRFLRTAGRTPRCRRRTGPGPTP